jgi:nitrate/nitrite-specific signal transduction histidine kinase
MTRGISLAVAAILIAALTVGGASLYLALRIHRINDAVDDEYERILLVDRCQAIFQQVISALHYMQFRGNFHRLDEVETQHAELVRHLESFRTFHATDPDFAEDPRERPAFTAVKGLAESLRDTIARLGDQPAEERELQPNDLEQLNLISTQLPRLTVQIKQAHGTRITRLTDASAQVMRLIGYLYIVFLVGGAGLIVFSARAAWREVTTPLKRLAVAATALAEGRSDQHVPVESANEIGRLSRAFNTMVDQLQARDREIRAAREQLERRVQELASLFRLGTQISGLHDLDQILDSVADTACELLGADAAAVLLLDLDRNMLTVRALSGPPDAFQPSVRLRKPIPLIEALDAETQHRQVLWPEFLQAHLSATLTRGGSVLGVICAASRTGREFSAAERDTLNALATLASIAVENARLAEKTRSLGILEERDRLAREIHDGLAQVLALLHLRLQRVQEQAARLGAEAIAAELRDLVTITDHAYDEVRHSIYGLRTPGSRGLGLIPTLSDYVQQFSAQADLPVSLDVPNAFAARLSSEAEVQLVRIIQEALANARKHAEATQAWVRLSSHEGYVQAVVEDNGRGFNPAHVEATGRRPIGLQSMRDRAASVGGGLQVDSAPGKGTRITAWLPIEA